MNQIDIYYNQYHNIPGDINEHFPTLKKYAEKCDIIYELGTRAFVSTWALLAGLPKKFVTIDIVHPSVYGGDMETVANACNSLGIDFKFILINSLDLEIEETDLLFIDTIHKYDQLSAELKRHGKKVNKYIIMHDTESCKDYVKNSAGVTEGGLQKAIDEFLSENKEWFVKEVFINNNGLTILGKEV